MLTKIVVDNENAFEVPILGVSPKESLLLRSITGLSAPDTNLFIGDYSRDGGVYQGRRVGNRNPVITFDLNPNPALGETVSGLRELLYKAFMDPLVDADFLKVDLYEDDGRVRYFVGYVETFDTEPFSQDTTAVISLLCPDPYIRDNIETVLYHPSGWLTVPFTYGGTAETGFEVIVNITGTTSAVTLDNNGKKMVFENAYQANDVLTINTTPGSRSATLTRSGVDTPQISKLTSGSPWLTLHSQRNLLRVYGATVGDSIAAVTMLRYTSAYWGV